MRRWVRAFSLAAIATLGTSCFAGLAMQCDRIDYAELKDFDRKVLAISYCLVKLRAELNGTRSQTLQDLLRNQLLTGGVASAARFEILILNGARDWCGAAAEDTEAVLKRKFSAKAPSCD